MATQKQRRRRAKEKRHDVRPRRDRRARATRPSSARANSSRERGRNPRRARDRPRRRRRRRRPSRREARRSRRRGVASLKRGAIVRADLPRDRPALGGDRLTRSPARSCRRSCCSRSSCRSATSWTARVAVAREAARAVQVGGRNGRGGRLRRGRVRVVARPRPRREDQEEARTLWLAIACRSPGSKVTSVPTRPSTTSSPQRISASPSTTTTQARSRTWWSRSS